MSQHDYSIANQGFPATRADINNVLSAIATNNSGTSAPSTQYAGQFWIDTTSSTWTLYIHDGADDIQFATIDTSANTVNFTDSALDVVTDTSPQLGGNLDLNSNDITGTGNINITGTIESSGNITGTLATASQPNITSVGTLTSFTSTGIDDNATSTAITIDSSERVGIGTTSPDPFIFHAKQGSGMGSYPTWESPAGRNIALFENSESESHVIIGSPTDGYGQLGFADPSYKYSGSIAYSHSGNYMRFATNGATERMRIDSSGNVLIGKTALDTSAGIVMLSSGRIDPTRDGAATALFNRLTSDGNIVEFKQDGTTEGSISVSGATVSYNGFTGTHWSRFTDNSTPTILKGTVLESLDEMCDWYNLEFDVTTQDEDGNDVTTTEKVPHVLTNTQSVGDTVTYNHEGTDVQATIVKEADVKHVKSKVSDTVDAKNVYGVFVAYDEDGEGYNDFYVASVGSFVVRIKANETIAKGDLLQSNGDGTAKVQSDDNIKSSSFAKVLSTTIIETYDDGSYLVPCSLMC